MPQAARLGDPHACPMADPKPHVGGVIVGPGVGHVLIGHQPAAVVGDVCTCVGPPNAIVAGSSKVLIHFKPAARQGDPTAHSGMITSGSPKVEIGG